MELAAWFGMGAYWERTLVREMRLMGARRNSRGGWPAADVRRGRLRLTALSEGMGPSHFRALALRMQGTSATALKARVKGAPTQDILDRWALAYLFARRRRLRGLSLALSQEGFPPRAKQNPLQQRVTRLWYQGCNRSDIAGVCNLSQGEVDRLLLAAPRRLTSTQISVRFGWSRDGVNQALSRRAFPAPDGSDSRGRWWWEATVQLWGQTAGLRTCPACGARVRGLAQHATVHDRRPLPAGPALDLS